MLHVRVQKYTILRMFEISNQKSFISMKQRMFLLLTLVAILFTSCGKIKRLTQINDTVDKTVIDSSSTTEVTHTVFVDTTVVIDGSKEVTIDTIESLDDSSKTVIDNEDVTVILFVDTATQTIKTTAKVKPRKARVKVSESTTIKQDSKVESKIVHRDNSVKKEVEKPPSKGNDHKRWSGFKFGVFITALVAVLLAVFRPPFITWIFALFRKRKSNE